MGSVAVKYAPCQRKCNEKLRGHLQATSRTYGTVLVKYSPIFISVPGNPLKSPFGTRSTRYAMEDQAL